MTHYAGKRYLRQIEKDFVLESLARNHRPQRIANDLQIEYGVTTTRQNIMSYKKRNPEIIQTLRTKFIESLGGCALIEKAERIAELEKMYEKFLENCSGCYSKENIEVLQGLIAQIQKEVEPLKIKGEGFENINTTNIINVKDLNDFLGGVHNGDIVNRAEDIKRRANGAGQERFAPVGN
jgi:hypothetical protein